MRSIFKTIMFSLLLSSGVAMAFSASEKKDDKKDDKKDKGHEPVDIVVWENAWKPVYRAFSLQEAMNTVQIDNEE